VQWAVWGVRNWVVGLNRWSKQYWRPHWGKGRGKEKELCTSTSHKQGRQWNTIKLEVYELSVGCLIRFGSATTDAEGGDVVLEGQFLCV